MGRRENVGACERGTPGKQSPFRSKCYEVVLTGPVILRSPVTGGICGAVESMTWAVRDAAGLSPRAASMRKHVSLATAPSVAVVKTQALQARGAAWQDAQQLAPVAFGIVMYLWPGGGHADNVDTRRVRGGQRQFRWWRRR